jgi:hypothetical protein
METIRANIRTLLTATKAVFGEKNIQKPMG